MKALFLPLGVLLFLPLLDKVGLPIAESLRPVFIYGIMGLGILVVTGFTGLLNLGAAAFMALGAYTFAIATSPVYPFQLGFSLGLLCAGIFGAIVGVLLSIPLLRLRGDYLAIVTLGFGEIVQDTLKNLESITKGTQGITSLPGPVLLGQEVSGGGYLPWYYVLLFFFTLFLFCIARLYHSPVGRLWCAIRDDELAAASMGIRTARMKLLSCLVAAAVWAMAGSLWASSLGSSGDPGNYDFQVSMLALCIVIVGGLTSLRGVLPGALLMVGFNSILLSRVTQWLASSGIITSESVISSPTNWKYSVFGLALILVMRFRPHGLFPEREAA